MPPALPRRSAAAAVLASAVEAAVPVPDARARSSADRTQRVLTADAVAEVERPREDAYPTPRPVSGTAPSASSVDRAYAPRAALGTGSLTPTATLATATSTSAALHLARRATWGATPGTVADITAIGASAWLDAQLNPLSAVPDTAMDQLASTSWPRLALRAWEVRDRYYPSSTGDLGYDVLQSYLARALWSRRQLLEVVVDFWTNHLVVTAPWGETWDSAHRFQEVVIRKYALGRYADMLVAAAKHPAMLNQLDNASSTKRAPNENFGREVLELHTVGVDGGYLESDIRRSALALTGMSIEDESGEYIYRQIRHHTGALSILGWSDANASAYGEKVGVAYLTHLARHPKTARRLATKLAVRFVSDNPPATLVDRLASVYTANDTRIAPVLKALFTSAEFAASAGQKTKRPLENMVSTVRALGVTPGTDTKGWLDDLLWAARTAGQAPMGWPAPNGYPDVASAWAGSGALLAVWNFHMGQGWAATSSSDPGVRYPSLRSLLPATLPTTHGGLVDALASRLLQRSVPSATRDAVCAFLDKTAASPLSSTDPAVGWRLPYVVALVLDTPEFAAR